MSRWITRRTVLLPLALVVVILGVGGIVVALSSNDVRCSKTEQRAMAEFAHYDGAAPAWESNPKITGGCTASFTVGAEPGTVMAWYQEQLLGHGWTVQPAPANTFPTYVEAERDGLRYMLMFEGPTDGAELEVQPGQTRVTISGDPYC